MVSSSKELKGCLPQTEQVFISIVSSSKELKASSPTRIPPDLRSVSSSKELKVVIADAVHWVPIVVNVSSSKELKEKISYHGYPQSQRRFILKGIERYLGRCLPVSRCSRFILKGIERYWIISTSTLSLFFMVSSSKELKEWIKTSLQPLWIVVFHPQRNWKLTLNSLVIASAKRFHPQRNWK